MKRVPRGGSEPATSSSPNVVAGTRVLGKQVEVGGMKIADIFSLGDHDGDCNHGAIPVTVVTEATLVMRAIAATPTAATTAMARGATMGGGL
jgi:hypothetical protein